MICGNLRFAGVDLLDVRDTEPATVRNLRKCVFCFVLFCWPQNLHQSLTISQLIGHELILSYLQLQMGIDIWFSCSGARHHHSLCLFPGAAHSLLTVKSWTKRRLYCREEQKCGFHMISPCLTSMKWGWNMIEWHHTHHTHHTPLWLVVWTTMILYRIVIIHIWYFYPPRSWWSPMTQSDYYPNCSSSL